MIQINKLFERKKEKNQEEKNRETIALWIETRDAMEAKWLTETQRVNGLKDVAKNILKHLPNNIKVFELSADIYAIRKEEKKTIGIENSEIVNLEGAEHYTKTGHLKTLDILKKDTDD